MRRGFTLIELIFVIVILGALVGIATSKFMVSRDDAKLVVAATNIKTLILKLNEYYITQGKLKTDSDAVLAVKEMTGVFTPIKLGDDECLKITGIADKSASVSINSAGTCAELWDIDAMTQIRAQIQADSNEIKVGGSRIKF